VDKRYLHYADGGDDKVGRVQVQVQNVLGVQVGTPLSVWLMRNLRTL
jgi:hypothetical protein